MTDAGSSAVAASACALTLHSLGIDAYMLAVAMIGAVFLQAWSDKATGRWRAMLQVLTSGFVGALLAQGIVDHADLSSRAAEMALAAFCGFGAFDLFSALSKQGDSIIGTMARRWGGEGKQ
jgi:hypothetical protein